MRVYHFVLCRYDHKSALLTSTCPRELGSATITDGRSSAQDSRDTKLKILISAESAELAREAAKEACLLAPGSMYLGGVSLSRLTAQFQDIARQIESGERGLSIHVVGGGGGGGGSVGGGVDYRCTKKVDGDLLGKEFDTYKEILEAVADKEDGVGGVGWSEEEVERLERMRTVVQPAAARVVGAAVAHQALETVWKKAAIVAAV